MLRDLLNDKKKIGKVLFLILLLVLIRAFEETIFYDPFLEYFKTEYSHIPLPKFSIPQMAKLFFSMGMRFYLNSMISLFLLYVIFKDKQIVKFTAFIYFILGSVLLISFMFTLTFFPHEKMTLFYIRRFLIQPIFILLFIPAFYYQKQFKK
ncbi:exosortase F system-associated membrane protein [Flavobacterium wongokense]|uniref:exosortase F system-associated membrane protein n=1 Tax=Flavobacterium wongokense TaxID=2910674 RepID=UPI001F4874C1|nr:exosortase F system-associated protein [Flavobacterium sp. WG47]MCF6130942.1 exosortase F system-associated protein [Flavobacterium sp. WG47]